MTDKRIFVEPVVYVIDGNPQTCHATAELIQNFGFQVRLFESPALFLEELNESRAGCVVFDVGKFDVGNTDLQQQLNQRGSSVQVIYLTSSASTTFTVRSLSNGAFTVLEKPVRDDEMWNAIQHAIQRSEIEFERQRHVLTLESRLKKLSPQDRAVLQLMLQGVKNRSMAKRLEVSLRTVENRRRRVFDIMQADSIAQLTRMIVEYEHNLLPSSSNRDIWLSLPFEKVAS